MSKDPLDEALGIDHDTVGLPTIQYMTPEDSRQVVEAEGDSEFARRNIKDIITRAKAAVETMIDVVDTGGLAKEAEALGNLLDKYVTANEKLVNLSREANATKNGDGPAKVVNNTQNVTFVGTTDDILKAVRKARGEVDVEDTLER